MSLVESFIVILISFTFGYWRGFKMGKSQITQPDDKIGEKI